MEFDKKQYIESQRHGWDSVAPAWEKWDKSLDMNMSFVNHKLIGDACIRDGHKVLDLGCGTGYPAILAAQTVGNNGSVIGLDLSEEMLKVAKRKAGELDIANIQFQSRDITTLPFEPASFDAVISRFCIMFLPDIQGAVNEIARVLKQGGYFSAAVWSAPNKNPFIKIPMDVLKKFIDIPTPPPGQPGLFRLSRHGDLLGMATASGLSGIADEEITGV